MLTAMSTNAKKCSTENRAYIDNSIKRYLEEYKVNTSADEVVVKEIRKQIELERQREIEREQNSQNNLYSNTNPEPSDPSSYIKWFTFIGITCLLAYKFHSLAK